MRFWIEKFLTQNDRKKKIRDYFLIYTILFVLISLFVFFAFIINRKSFVWKTDGLMQHYTALTYYGKWLRTILKGIFVDHSFSIPQWSFSLGYGADIISTLNYYCIGDPLSLLTVFVPSRYTEYLYNVLCIVRIYLAGAAFSCFCFRMKKGRLAAMAGAFSYTFCAYGLMASIRHPYFTNPMIYLPLLLIGVERIFHKEKPTLFMGMVCISAASNFYFFYMLVFAVAFYVIVRYFTFPHQERWKELGLCVARFAGYGLVGVLMSAVLLLPVVLLFFSGMRSTEGISHPLFYHLNYYGRMITGVLTANRIGKWTWLGLTAPCLLSIFVLFSQKKKRMALKIPLCIMTVFLLLPMFGSMLNGFNYVSNRWGWLYIALCSYILVSVWDEFFSLKRRQILFIAGGCSGYLLLLLLLERWATESSFVGVCLLLASLVLLLINACLGQERRVGRIIPFCLLGVVLLHVGVNAHYCYNYKNKGYVAEFQKSGTVYQKKTQIYTKAIRQVTAKEDSFCRYENHFEGKGDWNADLLMETHGTSFYWSLAKGNIARYLLDMSFTDWRDYLYQGNEKRTMVNALASVKYFVAPSRYSGSVPYGYEALKKAISTNKENRYRVYRNQYALPLGYTYSSCIPYEAYRQMSALERQEALLQGIVLGKDAGGAIPETKPVYTSENVDYEIRCGKHVVRREDGSFIVGKKRSKITIKFEGREDCETYLYVKGMDASFRTELDLYKDDDEELFPRKIYDRFSFPHRLKLAYRDLFKRSEDQGKFPIKVKSDSTNTQLYFRNSYDKYYLGQKDFLVNLGYQQEARTSVTLTFPERGVYRFDDLQVVCQPMDNYAAQVAALKEDVLENEKVGTNEVSGTISLDRDKILCLSIPYDKGWKAYVDGEETELFEANVMYMGIPLKAGDHTIRLVYHTYGLRTGFVLSVVGFALFGGLLLVYRRKRKPAAEVSKDADSENVDREKQED